MPRVSDECNIEAGSDLTKASTVETPILGDLPQGDAGAERAAQRNKEIALGRVGQPREIAECALWLTSGKASFVTAATLAPHGGLRL